MLFFGVLILIFLQIIRPQDFVPGIKGMELVQYSMVLFLTMLLFSPIEKRPIRGPQDKFAGLFFLSIILSTLTLFWIENIINTMIYVAKIALIYYFVIMVVNDEDKFKKVTWATIFLMWIVGLLGVLQYHGYDVTGAGMGWSPDKSVWQIKGIGNFDKPNDLAYSVVLVVPFSLGLIFQTRRFSVRVCAIIGFAFSVYCIYLTRSRGGQVAFFVAIVAWIYLWTSSRKWRRRMLIFGGIVIFAVFSVKSAGYRSDASAMGRVEAWSEGWQLLKSHPIIGVGKDQFREYHSVDTHSSYVRAAAELGLIGLYAFVGVLYYSIITVFAIQKAPQTREWRPYYAGFGSFIASYGVGSLFSTRTYDLVFLIVIALIGVLGRLALSDTEEVSSEGVLFPTVHLWSRYVFGLSTTVLIVWYFFLRQVW